MKPVTADPVAQDVVSAARLTSSTVVDTHEKKACNQREAMKKRMFEHTFISDDEDDTQDDVEYGFKSQ